MKGHPSAARTDVRPVRLATLVPLAGLLAALAVAGERPASAEDRVSVQGAYYREASNRIIQPMIEITKDLPHGLDIGGHFLVDAISSASIAQGALVDEVFQENRYEGSASLGYTIGRTRVGGFLRYSHEPDYQSYTGGLSLSHEIWERTGTIGLNIAGTYDGIFPPPPQTEKSLKAWFVGAGYTQAISPTTSGQLVYEVFSQRGFIPNVYITHPNLGREKVPGRRVRHAAAARVAQYFPAADLGLQLHYRFYLDQERLFHTGPWGMTAHTLEGRVYKQLGQDFELRLVYRHHIQGRGRFWCNARPDNGGDISCYPPGSEYHSFDAKFGNLDTNLVEVKLTWDMHPLLGGGLNFLGHGALNISYGYFFQSSPYGQAFTDRNAPPVIGDIPFTREYGGAHLIQTGYSLPF